MVSKNRPKYKELYIRAINDYAECKHQLSDCHKWIIEAARILKDNNLSEQLNEILNKQYGLTLMHSISQVDFNYKWKPDAILFGEIMNPDGKCEMIYPGK